MLCQVLFHHSRRASTDHKTSWRQHAHDFSQRSMKGDCGHRDLVVKHAGGIDDVHGSISESFKPAQCVMVQADAGRQEGVCHPQGGEHLRRFYHLRPDPFVGMHDVERTHLEEVIRFQSIHAKP
jgi:hypothetical protein